MGNLTDIELYQPIDTLKLVDENIWIVDGSVVRMAMYGTTIPFSTRMTVVRLNNGELWCHSPIELTQALKTEIDALGLVRHLVSPNKIMLTLALGLKRIQRRQFGHHQE